jgi:glutathione S-transferase
VQTTAPLLLLMGLLRRQSSLECAAATGALAALFLYFRRRRRDITLTYLDAKGSAEATRLALTIGRVPFRDERLSYAEVALLRDELPFGQVPTLRVGDELYCQSAAILRYAGRSAGLFPSDPESQLRCDMVLEICAEIARDLLPLWYKSVLRRDPTTGAPGVPLTQAQVQKVRNSVSTSYMPVGFQRLEKILGERTYFCGERMTIADLAFYVDATQIMAGTFLADTGVGPAVLLDCPNLRALRERVAARDDVAAYYRAEATRPTQRAAPMRRASPSA